MSTSTPTPAFNVSTPMRVLLGNVSTNLFVHHHSDSTHTNKQKRVPITGCNPNSVPRRQRQYDSGIISDRRTSASRLTHTTKNVRSIMAPVTSTMATMEDDTCEEATGFEVLNMNMTVDMRANSSTRTLTDDQLLTGSQNCLGSSSTADGRRRAAKIVCVGDIHGQWGEGDEMALRSLRPDLVLFVGDYGNEDLRVTSRIASFASRVDFGVATVFGNHDAHYTASSRKRQYAPYDSSTTCRVREQIKLLHGLDVSYRSKAFEEIGMSVCGGRAFSFGGPNWKYSSFFREFVGVNDMRDSSVKLARVATNSAHKNLIFLSHSGPVGLGDAPHDPCGKDWGEKPGGDYGDADLRHAIESARDQGFRVPLTVFGHMHNTLQDGKGKRIMVKTERDGRKTGEFSTTVMLNAAVVPRHRERYLNIPPLFHFQIVHTTELGNVASVEESWVACNGTVHESTKLFDASDRTTYTDASYLEEALTI